MQTMHQVDEFYYKITLKLKTGLVFKGLFFLIFYI